MVNSRIIIWKNILWRPAFKVCAIIYGFSGFVQWLFPNLLQKRGLVKMIPSLTWQIWIIIGLILIIGTILEGAYRLVTQQEAQFNNHINILQSELEELHKKYNALSTNLLDKYEERFFVTMIQDRIKAARFLMGRFANNASLKKVLDFLEAPIAVKVVSGEIDRKQVYDYFHHWIFMYYQAGKEFIEDYRKKDPGAWGSLKPLYEIMVELERQELGQAYTGDDWSSDKLNEALAEEGDL
jgi:hypothetical protein